MVFKIFKQKVSYLVMTQYPQKPPTAQEQYSWHSWQFSPASWFFVIGIAAKYRMCSQRTIG